MKLFLFFLIVCISISVPAQKKTSYKGLSEISGELLYSEIRCDNSKAILELDRGARFRDRDSAFFDLDNWFNNFNPNDKDQYKFDQYKAQYDLLKKNYKGIKLIVLSASASEPNFVYCGLYPLLFGLTKNNSTLLFHSFVSTKIYNTLNLNSREIAKELLNEQIYPSLKKFEFYLTLTDIKYFGISVIYFAKNFANKRDYDTKGGAIVLIAPIKKISDFINGKITDTDFLNLSDIYLIERDSSFPLKIKL
jgi:hypothetical protein